MDDPHQSEVGEERDEQMVRRVLDGNSYAFRGIVERYTPKLERYARSYLFTQQEREDLLQEIFIKTYTQLRRYDSRRPFSPWIYRIAHNVFVNAIRSKSRSKVFSVDWDEVFPHPFARERTDSDVLREELKQELNSSMQKIPAKYREPLVLYYWEDMDYQSISDILRIPVSTVGVRIHRGKALLKSAFESLHTAI